MCKNVGSTRMLAEPPVRLIEAFDVRMSPEMSENPLLREFGLGANRLSAADAFSDRISEVSRLFGLALNNVVD